MRTLISLAGFACLSGAQSRIPVDTLWGSFIPYDMPVNPGAQTLRGQGSAFGSSNLRLLLFRWRDRSP